MEGRTNKKKRDSTFEQWKRISGLTVSPPRATDIFPILKSFFFLGTNLGLADARNLIHVFSIRRRDATFCPWMRRCGICAQLLSFSEMRCYLMSLNMSSASRWALPPINSGSFGGGLLGRVFKPAPFNDVRVVSSPPTARFPFAAGGKYPSGPSVFRVMELFRLQNDPLGLLFIDCGSLTGCATDLWASSPAPSGSYPLGLGLASPPNGCSSPSVGIPLFLLQKPPLEFLPRLNPKVDEMLNPPGVLGREDSPREASETGEYSDERRKDNKFRRPLGRRGDFVLGVLGERGKVSVT